MSAQQSLRLELPLPRLEPPRMSAPQPLRLAPPYLRLELPRLSSPQLLDAQVGRFFRRTECWARTWTMKNGA
jgi:hypothetical protein